MINYLTAGPHMINYLLFYLVGKQSAVPVIKKRVVIPNQHENRNEMWA